ncbi:MAG TPA: CBS domain-containing protein [Enhygromyxa sp.]|nr:CBS domain-containing protein [Enhygromyxa sp.]
MSIEAIMTRTVLSVGPATTVREAIRLIEDSEIRHLPVVDGEGGSLLGIVSDRDLREFRIPLLVEIERFGDADRERTDELLDTPISEVMAAEVVSVDSSETVESVIDAMLEYKVGAVPVVDRHSEELVGIVSYVDVLRYARELLRE